MLCGLQESFEYSNAPVDFRDKILKIAFTGGLRKQKNGMVSFLEGPKIMQIQNH